MCKKMRVLGIHIYLLECLAPECPHRAFVKPIFHMIESVDGPF